MHLVEILKFRHVPAAGVSIGLTRRCPLHCAHCSTNSSMQSEEYPAKIFERFVGSFQAHDRPEIMSLSGGEALLRPQLVCSLAERARSVGTRTSVLSGLFFARQGRIPSAIQRAIDAVDHFSISLDIFHEREVPRDKVFRVLDTVLDRGIDVSMHLVGSGADDPYLDTLIKDVRDRFHERVPMLVNVVSYFGRARDWMQSTDRARDQRPEANPCTMAAWPVVGFNGCIAACGNDNVFDRLPEHLILGDAAVDDWATVRRRTQESNMLRAIRLFGPEFIASRARKDKTSCNGYCGTCMALSEEQALGQHLDGVLNQPSTKVLEAQVKAMLDRAGAQSFLRRHGIPRYAELAMLGASE